MQPKIFVRLTFCCWLLIAKNNNPLSSFFALLFFFLIFGLNFRRHRLLRIDNIMFAEFDGDFMNSQPYFIPLCSHVFAMASIIVNPILLFWLTKRVQKSKLSRISSLGFNSIMSRVSFLCRRASVRNFDRTFR